MLAAEHSVLLRYVSFLRTSCAGSWTRTRKIFCFGRPIFSEITCYDNQITRSTAELLAPETSKDKVLFYKLCFRCFGGPGRIRTGDLVN